MRIGKHIPSERVGTIFIEGREWIHCIAKALAHLVALFVQNKSVGDNSLKCALIAHHGSYCMEGKKPTSCLVNAFGDEICSLTEVGAIDLCKGLLSIGHRSRIEPDINQIALPYHLAAIIRNEEKVIDVGTVDIYLRKILIRIVAGDKSLLLQRVGGHDPCGYRFLQFLVKLCY